MDLTRLKFFIFFFIHKMAEAFQTINVILTAQQVQHINERQLLTWLNMRERRSFF